MKILKNAAFVSGVAFISFIVGMTCMSVGEMPKPSTGPYDITLPLMMAGLLICPFVLGIIAGKNGDV